MRWYGSIFAISALVGGAASYAWNPVGVVSAGASGGIVGLFAAALVVGFHFPSGALRTAMTIGAMRILLPTLLPFLQGTSAGPVDVSAHLGGAMGGTLIGLVLLKQWTDDEPPRRSVFAGIVTASFAVCAVASLAFAARDRQIALAFDLRLPRDFQQQVAQSAELIKAYPRDPRIRYARAAARLSHRSAARPTPPSEARRPASASNGLILPPKGAGVGLEGTEAGSVEPLSRRALTALHRSEMIYDTLKLSKALRVSFTPEQSDTLAQAFAESTEDSVATKLDIAELKAEIADLRTELRTEIAGLRGELGSEIAGLRGEFSTEIASVRAEIATLKVDMVRWIVGAIAFNLVGTLGLMIAVSELVLKTR